MSDDPDESAAKRAEYLSSAIAALTRLGFTSEQIRAFRRPEPKPYPAHWRTRSDEEAS